MIPAMMSEAEPEPCADGAVGVANAVRRIGFIKRAQQLGFTLDEIGALLALRIDPDTSCDAVEERAEQAIARIDGKVSELQRMRAALGELVQACHARRPTDDCPILDALEPKGNGNARQR